MVSIKGRIGFVLLAIWLIITGAVTLFHLSFESLTVVQALLAFAAGGCILFGV